jgi:site-specific recombinase XerD
LYGDTRIIDIDSSSIRAALKSYGQNRAPATANRMRACLSSVFKYAVKECDYLDNNPVKRVSSLTENNKIVRYLSDEERTALIEACKTSESAILNVT